MVAAPNALPFIKNKNFLQVSGEFRDQPLKFLTENTSIYGRSFRARLVFRELTITSDPVWMRYILQTHQKDFGRGYAYQVLKLALGNGLLVNEGDSWMRQRRLAQPAFHKQRLQGLFDVMETKGNDFVKSLAEQRGQEVRITDAFWKVTSDIVIATLLGGVGFSGEDRIQSAIVEMQEYLVDRIRKPISIPFMYINGRQRRFKQLMAAFNADIYAIMEEKRQQGPGGNDLISMLMEAEDEDTGERMSDQQLRDELLTIYVAGHETSSYALSWTVFLLAQHPEQCRKVKEELAAIPNIDHIGYEGLRALPYLHQVLLESMRMYPPAWIAGRKILADHVIDHTPVKKDDAILLNIYGLHHDPVYWPEPWKFQPERFSAEAQKERDKFTYLPFGAGPRMCIGNNFAIMEITMLLAKLFHHFDFEVIEPEKVVPEPLITLRPKDGITVKVR